MRRLACLLVLAPGLALAQGHDPMPPLARQAPLRLGGYVQPGFLFTRDTPFNAQDRDGFVLFDARLMGEGRSALADDVDLAFKFNFDVSAGTFAVRDVYGSVTLYDRLALDVGQVKVPFTLAERTSEARLQFPVHTPVRTRSQLLRGAGLTHGRDRGARLRADGLVGQVWLSGEAGIFNGEGQNAVENLDDEYLYAGRFEIGPLGALDHDEPDLTNSKPLFALGFSLSYTPSSAGRAQGVGDTGAKDLRYAADLRLRFAGFSLRGELTHSSQDGEGDSQDVERYGVYVQGGYVLPLGMRVQLEPVVRWSQYDNHDGSDGVVEVATADGVEARYDIPDNSEIRMIDLGLNAYLAGHALKVMVMYRLTDFLEGPKTDAGLRELTRTGKLGGDAGSGTVLIGDAFYTLVQVGWL
ncbi:MAG: hypothetical protein H6706_05865 [Myxococcales bacterium]|nr:hypothetical protein [Myxococcales bacterium]